MKPSYLITGLVVIVLLVGLYFLWSNQSMTPGTTPTTTKPGTTTPTTGTTPTTTAPGATTPGSTRTSPSTKAVLSYNDAVKIYGSSGYRIQFSQCHGTPGTLAVKRGVKFMLDNRDKVVHKITYSNQSVILSPLGYAIVSARNVGIYPITCDGGGAATLNVQA